MSAQTIFSPFKLFLIVIVLGRSTWDIACLKAFALHIFLNPARGGSKLVWGTMNTKDTYNAKHYIEPAQINF